MTLWKKFLRCSYLEPYVSKSGYTLYMDLLESSRKEIGAYGESAAAEYLRRHGFKKFKRNVTRKIGELDIVARKKNVLHIVEVKSIACYEFPDIQSGRGSLFNPAENLHKAKIQQVVRTGQWYVAEQKWKGEWQVDGVTVLIRRRDGVARVHYFPHIV